MFPVLYDMSLGASVVILAVLLLRLLLKSLPRRCFLLLWAVVLLRLLCPILPQTAFSVIPQSIAAFAEETIIAAEEREQISVLSAACRMARIRRCGQRWSGYRLCQD